jgi:photosystem II stability/assembly factor-like uncharacterized protein
MRTTKGPFTAAAGIIALLLFYCSASAQTEWTEVFPAPEQIGLAGITFLTPDIGITVGGKGEIMRSTDGGQSWYPEYVTHYQTLWGITKISYSTAIAVGDSGIILESTNRGISWFRLPSSTSNNLKAVAFINSTVGYAIGDRQTIIKTTDAGLSWIKMPVAIDTGMTLRGVAILNPDTVICVGGSYTIRTSNGGATWQVVDSSSYYSLNSTAFFDSDTGIAVGASGLELRTTNSGLNWNASYVEDPWGDYQNFFGIYVFDNQQAMVNYNEGFFYTKDAGKTLGEVMSGVFDGYTNLSFATRLNGTAVGPGSFGAPIINTTDGGQDWHPQVIYYYNTIRSICAIDVNHVIVVGDNRTLIRTSNRDASWSRILPIAPLSLRSVKFFGYDAGIAVGDSGTIYSTNDTGLTWHQQHSIVDNRLNSVVLIDDMNAFIAGDSGVILKTTDGGINWIKQQSGVTANLSGIFFLNANDGFVVGNAGTILTTTNGGVNWSKSDDSIYSDLSAISFSNDYTGAIVGRNGTILWTTNEGISWKKISTSAANDLNCLTFGRDDTCYAAGASGIILRITDNGRNCSQINNTSVFYDVIGSGHIRQNTDINFYGVSFANPDTLYVTGDSGIVMKSPLAGTYNYWETQFSTTTNDLHGVFCHDSNNAVAVGDTGTILHTQVGGSIWLHQNSNVPYNLESIDFVNRDTGIIAGQHGTILYTTNDGSDWVNRSVDTINYYGAFLSNGNTATVVGDSGTILRSTNAGITWTKYKILSNATLRGVAFQNHDTGVAVGDSGYIFNTTDAGANWQFDSSRTSNNFASVCFAATDTCFAVANGTEWIQATSHTGYTKNVYVVLRSTNAGESWIAIHNNYDEYDPEDNHLFDLSYTNGLTGWATGQGTISITTDGGATWAWSGGASSNLYSISMFKYTGYAVGGKGTIVRLATGGVTSKEWFNYSNKNIDFGSIRLDSIQTDSISITNWNSDTVSLDLWYYNSNAFSISSISFMLAPSESKNLYMTFSPTSTGQQKGVFIFSYDGVPSTDTIFVTGIGIGSVFATDARELNFGNIPQDSSSTKKITISDPGNAPLNISQVYSTNSHFQVPGNFITVFTNENDSVPVTFKPDGVQEYSGYIIFVSDAITSPDSIKVTGDGLSGVKENADVIPGSYGLEQNYPNPFDPVTNISFSIARESQVKLCVYNVLGEMVATLADEKMAGGSYTANFDATALPNGVYFYKLNAEEFNATRTMVLAR